MKIQLFEAAALGAALVAFVACGEGGPTAWDGAPAHPGAPAQKVLGRPPVDLDLSLYVPTAAGGHILIYDIQNGFVYAGAASEGRLLLQYNQTDLKLVGGAARCLFRDNELVDAATGTVEFSNRARGLYDGNGVRVYEIRQYSLIRSGPAKTASGKEDPVFTATERIDGASTARKLVLAALAAGTCGDPPLPPAA